MGNEPVVYSDRAGLSTTATEVAPVREFGETRHGPPVQVDLTISPGLQQSTIALMLDEFLVQAAKDL
jgi:hypothetical protein